MNEHFKSKADSINHVSESRQTEREFSEAKKRHMHQKSIQMLVSNEALHNHSESHFQQNDITMPEELLHPKTSCLNDSLQNAVNVDQSAPTEKEVKDTLSKLKNGKCEGVDKIKMEQLK